MENEIIRQINIISNEPTHRFHFLAVYIKNNLDLIPLLHIKQLAKNAFTSTATITRFCKSLNLDGYRELIHIIKYYNNIIEEEPHHWISTNKQFFNSVYQRYTDVSKTIHNSFRLLISQEQIITIISKLIISGTRINIFAVGGTYIVAQDFINKLLRIGFDVLSASDYHSGYFIAQNVKPDHLNIIVSYSGETKDLIELAKVIKNNSSKILLVSKNINNTIMQYADYKIMIDSDEKISRTISYTSRFALLFALDTIFNMICESDPIKYNAILKKTMVEKF